MIPYQNESKVHHDILAERDMYFAQATSEKNLQLRVNSFLKTMLYLLGDI